MIGQTIAHYRITAKLGAGGMGEVYRATDTKLGRDVALKVLPEAFAADQQRMARFQREAQLLASLSHPNIAAIYGLEETSPTAGDLSIQPARAGSTRCFALAMELVEGPTLAERIAQGPVPPEEALPIARQITEALEYAHERGIIHRDLKPANIKLTREDQVRVLDFGLAKALADDPTAPDISNSPTLSMAATKDGLIMGTAAYMSPEQARGRSVDRRADVWAFGVVLFELLTGTRAFAGEDISITLANVIKEDPDWTKISAHTPPRIRELLRRCLAKDVRQRLQAIGEARIILEGAIAHPEVDERAAGAGHRAIRPAAQTLQLWLPWTVAAAALLLAAVTLVTLWPRPAPPPLVRRFQVQLPHGHTLAPVWGYLTISPDGSDTIYLASQPDKPGWHAFRRSSSQLQAVPLVEETMQMPFFSPDGKWVGYFAGGKLKKMPVTGGAPITLADAPGPRGGSWSAEGKIAFASLNTGGLFEVSAEGGAARQLTVPNRKSGESIHHSPEFLPDGKHLLFTMINLSADLDDQSIAVLSLATGEWREVLRGGFQAAYLASGHLVYSRTGVLMAVPFDLSSLQTAGQAVPIVENVFLDATSLRSLYSVSRDGTLVYATSGALESLQLAWVDRKGKETPITASGRLYQNPRLSPDGRSMVSRIAGTNVDIFLMDIARGATSRLTFSAGEDESPVWAANGSRVAYGGSVLIGRRLLNWKRADGGGSEETLWEGGTHTHLSSASADGMLLAFTDYDSISSGDIWTLPLTGERKPRLFLKTPFNEYDAKFSPDGRWLAYTSDESGRTEVYVQAFPGPGGKWQVSVNGGHSPVWARNGRELFYRNASHTLAVSVPAGATFSPGTPQTLFSGEFSETPRLEANYDVAPDGRFLVVKGTKTAGLITSYIVVLNLMEELKSRIPVGKK